MNLLNKNVLKVLLITVFAVSCCLLIAGCSDLSTPYDINNKDGYTVSVKFDANGGTFGDNASLSVMVDSFDPTVSTEIALLSPDDPARGDTNSFVAQKSESFLVGWYRDRIDNGDGTFSYSGKWDFENDRLTVDPEGSYSADEPVMTLYAAWQPRFKVEFYDLDSSELLDTYIFDPNYGLEINIPFVDEKKGEYKMYKFPEKSGYTFKNVYIDEAATQAIDTTTYLHPGVIDYDNAVVSGETLKLYVEWTQGEWYYIYDAKQLKKHADTDSNLVICADLDLEGKGWPEDLLDKDFSGTVIGNGHTVSNFDIDSIYNIEEYGNMTDIKFILSDNSDS
ncbi:MAG: hypothetical protein IKT46_04860 [Clostridia bacterium]|nr:hypothetical protein [Clostridia bacterium]